MDAERAEASARTVAAFEDAFASSTNRIVYYVFGALGVTAAIIRIQKYLRSKRVVKVKDLPDSSSRQHLAAVLNDKGTSALGDHPPSDSTARSY